MKQKTILFAAFTAAAFFNVANYTAAQVTIGGSDAPKAGAILDLNSATKGGLLLSHIHLAKQTHIPAGQLVGLASEQDVNAELTGTIVYNTNTLLKLEVSQQNSIDMPGRGIYVWDGNRWNKIGAPEHAITFAPYNLGADPTQFNSGEYASLSPAKRQIRYLKDCTLANAVNVWGDLFQWGRIADGHEKRNSSTILGPLSQTDVDDNGQPKAGTGQGQFIKNSANWYGGTIPAAENLWGNGESRTGQTDNQGGVLYTDGKYYQNTDWAIRANNPCVSMGAGWRVPTQDEWERLVDYNGNPSLDGGDITAMLPTGKATSSTNSASLTLVPVAGGIASTDWVENTATQLGGYAVYKTADWTAATGYNSGAKSLYEAAAPEPLLFLPAAGRRLTDGTFIYRGSYGHYWSSTVTNSNSSLFLRLIKTEVSASVSISPAAGFSVRCVKN